MLSMMRTELSIVESQPYNAETSIRALCRNDVTPNDAFYVRNHFQIPIIDSKHWKLKVTGAVRTSQTFSLKEIKSMPAKKLLVTTECAGNGRSRMQPLPPSTPWRDHAVATAEWTGTQLRNILSKTKPDEKATEVLFVGADSGVEDGRALPFERSLPLSEALHRDVILAYGMNSHPLPRIHGFPVRAIVPRWYGMASVKWLNEIRVLSKPFKGYFQKKRYIYGASRNMANSYQDNHPVTLVRVKSIILDPPEGTVLQCGQRCIVSGLAWSGSGRIVKVEFRTHNMSWQAARLSSDLGPYTWRRWSIGWKPKNCGRYILMSRATDDGGLSQPEQPVWNRYGYGYNSVLTRSVLVEEVNSEAGK